MLISSIHNMPDSFKLTFFGDDQEGNEAKAHDKFTQCISGIVSDPLNYAIHMGDACDAFWYDDYRYDPDITYVSPLEQLESEKKQLKPLAETGRLLSILEGNHERALNKTVGKFADKLAQELREFNTVNEYPLAGTFAQKLEFYGTDKRLMFKIYVTHGRKSISSVSPDPIRREAYKRYRLQLLLKDKSGDCICMVRGHSHLVLVAPPIPTLYLYSAGGKIKQGYTSVGKGSSSDLIPPENRFYGCSGSFLRTQLVGKTTYSEVSEMNPVEIGYLEGTVKDRQFVDLKEVKL